MMPNGRACRSRPPNLLLTRNDNCSTDTLEAMLVSCSPSVLQGSRSVAGLGLEDVFLTNMQKKNYFTRAKASEETRDDDIVDDFCVQQPEKKRRLSTEQVKSLEKSFDVDNKLEPDRKLQLAKELNLQPRQVAVWFQNRRARWKTKQLEKDYDALKTSFVSLKIDYDSLLQEKEQLQAEVNSLKSKLQGLNSNQEDRMPWHSDQVTEGQKLDGCKEPPGKFNKDESTAHTLDCQTKSELANDDEYSESKREVSSSSGGDDSAVCDANSPHPAINSCLSNVEQEVSYTRLPFVATLNVADVATFVESSTCNKTLIPPQTYQQIFKTEAAFFEEEPCNYFFHTDEQGQFPWWN